MQDNFWKHERLAKQNQIVLNDESHSQDAMSGEERKSDAAVAAYRFQKLSCTKQKLGNMKYFIPSLLFLILTFFSGCSQETTKKNTIPLVAVSIPPYVSLVRAIAEDTITVHAVIGGNFDPHTAEATPRQMDMIQNADLFIGVGEGYETKLLKTLTERSRRVSVLQMNQQIPLLPYAKDTNFIDPCGHSAPISSTSEDLHFWLSPKRLMMQVEILIQALSDLIPENSPLYHTNGQALLKKLRTLDAQLKEQLLPYQGKSIIVSHSSLGYFCHDYHLIQIAIEYEGKNPLPNDISRIYAQIKHFDVICAFTSPQFNNKGAKMVANQLNLRIESFDPLAEDVLATIEKIGNDLAKPHHHSI